MAVNVLDIKQQNVHTVLWTLYSRKTATIRELSQLTGLSFATVGNILSDLVEKGEVVPGELVSATGGRPSQAYSFSAEHAHVLALSARVRDGKNGICACVANLYGEIVRQTEYSCENMELSSFENIIDACLCACPTIRVLAVSLPGVVHNGVALTNDYEQLVGVPFLEHFRSKYQMPVIVENDVNAAVYGYSDRAGQPCVLAGIYFPRYFAPGSGIMIDGKILKGAGGYAGEVALLPLGIDWVSVDYHNPKEIGPAILKLVSTVCAIVNPAHVVLYGDFFTDGLREAIRRAIPAFAEKEIFPSLSFSDALETDILSGLTAQAIAVYRNGAGEHCGQCEF